jgi:hypothetical protein
MAFKCGLALLLLSCICATALPVKQPLRGKLGRLKARKFKSADYTDAQGKTVALNFESSFEGFATASEIVILKLEADGKWHVASYSIKG